MSALVVFCFYVTVIALGLGVIGLIADVWLEHDRRRRRDLVRREWIEEWRREWAA